MRSCLRAVLVLLLPAASALAQLPPWSLPAQTEADRGLRSFLEHEVAAIEAQSLDRTIMSRADWEGRRDQLRTELKEMLGLHPEPPRTALQPVVTSTVEGDGYVVENLHFQPMPRLYLAANLYRPKVIDGTLPAILYVCGHSDVKKDGVSLGNKTHYHAHGVWFARHGYVCLILDTVQWGELVGHHHGTYRLGRWWWASRGYTPAGVEAWNGIRALDYLQSRPEVDPERLGMTGRSGGGAYTWWVAAVDERVKVAAPTAGIATLRNHVLDGCIEGHCDCMFMHNTFRWDFDRVAALVAPRPLLILNTDKDDIFPLDGVYSIYRSARRIYSMLGAEDRIGLQIAEGPHQDTQALNVGAFAWFERFLKGAAPTATFDEAAKPSIPPERLRVFSKLPGDERTTRIDEDFVASAPPPRVPKSSGEWAALRDGWMAALRDRVFREPSDAAPEGRAEALGLVVEKRGDGPDAITLVLTPAPGSPWTGDERKQTHLRRRFLLLGTSLEREQVAVIRGFVRNLRAADGARPVRIQAHGDLAALALYAAILEPGVAGLDLADLPETHVSGPCLPSVLRFLDLPQALALAAERVPVTVHGARPQAWTFATATASALDWKTLVVRPAAEIIDVREISDAPASCAFTDLIRPRDSWVCVFCEGDSHVPGTNGAIRVLTSADGNQWSSAALMREAAVGLRDPKFSAMPDGRLMLLMGGSIYDGADGDPKRPLLTRPSGGDTSYPGMVEASPGEVWTSYDSSPEGPAAIYLARVRAAGRRPSLLKKAPSASVGR